jgi:predicted nucleic acid-binding protein
VFWPDSISLLDTSRIVHARLPSWRSVTDTYLLALAAANGGKLATLDQRLGVDATLGGAAALHLIETPDSAPPAAP